MFTFWGTRLPACSSLQLLLDLEVYVEYILPASRWGLPRPTLNRAPPVGTEPVASWSVRRLTILSDCVRWERTWVLAHLTCPTKEDKGQANTAAVHISFYLNKCIYEAVSALGFLLSWPVNSCCQNISVLWAWMNLLSHFQNCSFLLAVAPNNLRRIRA